MPTTQQTWVETQSIEFAHHVAPAPVHADGVRSVQVWPPSTLCATSASSSGPRPAIQQSEVVGQEMPSTFSMELTGISVYWFQVVPSVVTRSPWPTRSFELTTLVSPTTATQNWVPDTHETGEIAGP